MSSKGLTHLVDTEWSFAPKLLLTALNTSSALPRRPSYREGNSRTTTAFIHLSIYVILRI
uniref:Uncharacterized protein n=1 Tax=Picea glauca TaxID=3330 RepID=A0A101M224_PICGL|nr:hypothetical protein ABT39_MTgene2846 [Picea glauca]QHR87620.1 hypothetical protein Q903MT_gene1632 [Picea sitchensis]